jgi:hypothetical protein
MAKVVIDIHDDTPSLGETCNPVTPLRCKTFHAHCLLEERPFYFVVGLLEIHFRDDPTELLPVELVDGFMEDHHPF